MADEVAFDLDPISKKSLFSAFKTMDENSKTALKTEVASITGWVASDMVAAANRTTKPIQSAAIARSVRAKKDRLPSIQLGGTIAKLSNGTPVGLILKGNEFGSNTYKQFPNWSGSSPTGRGSAGWWIYPTLRRSQPKLTRQWKEAIEKYITNPWGRN